MLIKEDVKIVEISTNALRRLFENFDEMKKVFQKMFYLERVNFDLDCSAKPMTPKKLKLLEAIFGRRGKGCTVTNTIEQKMFTQIYEGRKKYLILS